MRKIIYFFIFTALFFSCNHENKADKYRTEKHVQDSVALIEQQRSLAYYESQLEQLMPQADSLLQYFKYERNEKYQDRGYYVVNGKNGLRILVRDDGKDILIYRAGKRIESTNDPQYERAQHLQIVISDIKECEKRIQRTSLEVQKYQKRLQK